MTTQMTISRRLRGEIRWPHHPNDNQPPMGEGGEAGAFCLLPKQQSATALGEGWNKGGRDLPKLQSATAPGKGGRVEEESSDDIRREGDKKALLSLSWGERRSREHREVDDCGRRRQRTQEEEEEVQCISLIAFIPACIFPPSSFRAWAEGGQRRWQRLPFPCRMTTNNSRRQSGVVGATRF